MQRGVGAVVLDVFAVDDEVGDLGAVLRGGLELLDDMLEASNCAGRVLASLRVAGGGVAEEQRGGREEAGGFEEELVVGGVGGCDARRWLSGTSSFLRVQPFFAPRV